MKKIKKSPTRKASTKKGQKKPTKNNTLVFLKYLPALVITLFATFLWQQPHLAIKNQENGVLAYATNTSSAGLLDSTNAQRSANGVGTLISASKLTSAAQAKANDMVSRDYWSHQTPDGEQPWVFIANAGYQYLSAGENLAYGFSNSSATVTGWMNSPSHKANLLSTNFTEVGFGIANSPNFVASGPQTVVVAMYGKPQVASAATPPPAAITPAPAAPKATPKTEVKQAEEAKTHDPVPTPVAEPEPLAKETEVAIEDLKEEPITVAYSDTNDESGSAVTKTVKRVQLLTGGYAIWSATFITIFISMAGLLWAIHKGFRIRNWLLASEKFIVSHLHWDLAILSLFFLGYILLSTSGVIK